MSEREDLVSVYGAIDQAVVNDRGLQSVVAQFIPEYADDRAVGWYQDFLRWTAEIAGQSHLPDYQRALGNLREPESAWMAVRRLHVMAVAARVGPIGFDTTQDDLDAMIERTLAVPRIAGPVVEGGTSLVSFLKDPANFAKIGDWSKMIQRGVAEDVLDSQLAVFAAVAPCSSELVEVPTPGDQFPATELTTTFTTSDVSFAQATRFLEPSNWPGCSSFWCLMTFLSEDADGRRHYHEKVSLDCHNTTVGGTWTAEAYLQFMPQTWSGGASVTYALEPNVPNTMIDVDEGYLIVQELPGGGVQVDTAKRIRFSYTFDGPALAVVMCALGYGQAAEQLVLGCAFQNKDDPNAGSDLMSTPDPPAEPHMHHHAPPPATTGTPGGSSGVSDPGDKLKKILDECLTAYRKSCDKVMAKTYTADDLVSDVAGSWARYVRGAAAAVDLLAKAAAGCPDPGAGPVTSPGAGPVAGNAG